MHRRSRLALPAALLALLLPLAACGDDGSEDGATGLDAVTVSGDVGTVPEVDLGADMTAGKVDTEVVTEGDGPALADGDQVLANYWLGNGYSGKEVQDSFGADNAGILITVGAPAEQPQTLDQLLGQVAAKAVDAGTTVGSRVVLTGATEDALGLPGVPELGLGNRDPVVLVVDLESQPLSGPDGTTRTAPRWAPSIVAKDGKPTALDFKGTPEPTDQLQTYVRVEGTGPKVEKGDLLVADYLGQVYGGAKPFDESYSRGTPIPTGIGLGQVVKGWDQALVGVPVGSRVIMAIPPDLGYGAQGQPSAGIKGTDTLYFIVDVLGAA